MAFTAITSTEVQVGKPVTSSIFTKVRENFDDHESRLQSLEAITSKVIIWDFPILNATSASSYTGLTYWRAPFSFTLNDAKVIIYEAGTLTGTLEIDILKNTSLDPSGMASVFTVLPSIDFATASDYDESTNATFDVGQQSVSAGDYLRLDVTSLPSGGVLGKFNVYLIGEI
jgi:hypothetical protein